MNWITKPQGLEYAPIIRLSDTDARYLQADAECSLRTRRARVSVLPLAHGTYHGSSEAPTEMLQRWRMRT